MSDQQVVDAAWARPVPVPDDVTAPFWAAAREGRLVVQRCARCGTFQHPPRARCTSCGGEPVFTEVSGDATLVSWTTAHDPVVPGRPRGLAPVVIVVVELVEQPGLWLVSDVDEPAELRIGANMCVAFDATAGDQVLPRFHPVEEPS
ncbi:MAG: OB-fold domain-containing protein [Pseudonocardia sp.]|uniref:Zn-ribbon domain-containing OB-fold protein n=1 Tax=unclassified Pseudonocardia TaxID=2619320 RepID=UPI00086EB0AF|nr:MULTISPECIES: zinc ribbon domain-containing protein [unclassified Pseudonocardia]MBN9110230.1 OB-fold domain-containing protein [Pseudonocardia sp.]ODV06362.1 MAG: hypothetical protein ABT15_12675 [Pseudonocardia sp. SCN 73-27]